MRAAAIALLAIACSARPFDGAASSGSGDTGSGDASDGIASSGPGSGTEEGASPETCGNGRVDPGEQCDDGNDVDADGCNVDCVVSGSVRWSIQMDDVRCSRLAADRQGGVFMSGRTEPNLYWIARIAEPGEVVWQTPDGRLPALLIGLSDGLLAGWEDVLSPAQGLVLAYDGLGMLRSETMLDEPDAEELDFFAHARVADGQDPVVVSNSDLTDGSERLVAWRFDTDGKLVDTRVLSEGADVPHGSHIATTSDGTIILAASDHIWAYTPSGQLLWDGTLSGTRELNDLDSASDGSLLAVSFYAESADGPYVHLVERYAPGGTLATSWELEPSRDDAYATKAALAVDQHDHVLVAGSYRSETDILYQELRLAKYSSEGTLRWSASWGADPETTGEDPSPESLAIAANGDAVLMFNHGIIEPRCSIVAIAP